MRRDTSVAAVAVSAMALSTLALAASTLQVNSNTWAPTGDMSQPRAGAAAVLLYDGSILVTGGMNDAGVTATTERYNPLPGRFVRARAMATPRANHTSTLLPDGRVLVAGGISADGRASNLAELYDPLADAWTPVAPLGWARAGHTATALHDGRVVIVGGNDGSVSLRSIEIYNPDLGTFEASNARMTDARTGHAAALASDRTLLVTGGFDGKNILSSAEIYDPFFDMVMPGPPLSTPRIGQSATTLLGGNVLVAGGANRAGELVSAEVYDSSTRAFSPTGNSMIVARQRHQALLLPHNGQVLIVGGIGGGAAVSAAEVYVAWQGPGGTFYRTNAPAVARIWSAATALSFVPSVKVRSGPGDGLLLLAGGASAADASAPFNSSELYGFATVRTDKADYAPGTPVTITGGGWQPGETVTLTLQESPGFDEHQPLLAVADANGHIVNAEFAPDEHDLNILFYLTASGSASQAQTTFTDSLNTISATLDGQSTVTRVRPGPITANVTVTTASTTWRSTGWRLASAVGAFTCQNTANHNTDGTFSESFAIATPRGVGTYNAYFAAFSDNNCATVPSATFTLSNAVIVDAGVSMADTTSPIVVSIERASTSPTNLSNVSWTITFSEAVTGIAASDFSLISSGVKGTPAITALSGSGASYRVTASTGAGSGTIGLNLVDDDSIVDAAGNALGGPGVGNGSAAGAVFTLDRTLMPQVTAASKTYDGTTAATIVTRALIGNIAAGDIVSLTGGTATFDTQEVGSGKTVTAMGLSLTGADALKYVLSSTTATTLATIGVQETEKATPSEDGSGASETPGVAAVAGIAQPIRTAASWMPIFLPTTAETPSTPVGGSGVTDALPRMPIAPTTESSGDGSAISPDADEPREIPPTITAVAMSGARARAAKVNVGLVAGAPPANLPMIEGVRSSMILEGPRRSSLLRHQARSRPSSRPLRSLSVTSTRTPSRSTASSVQSRSTPRDTMHGVRVADQRVRSKYQSKSAKSARNVRVKADPRATKRQAVTRGPSDKSKQTPTPRGARRAQLTTKKARLSPSATSRRR